MRNNDKAIEYVSKFKSDDLLNSIRFIEKKKWWGTHYFTPMGKAVAELVFQDGICLRCIEPMPLANGNVFNKSEKFW